MEKRPVGCSECNRLRVALGTGIAQASLEHTPPKSQAEACRCLQKTLGGYGALRTMFLEPKFPPPVS